MSLGFPWKKIGHGCQVFLEEIQILLGGGGFDARKDGVMRIVTFNGFPKFLSPFDFLFSRCDKIVLRVAPWDKLA